MEDIHRILGESRVIAIVGLSRKEHTDSRRVAKYLLSQGYDIIPVNPNAKYLLGMRSYPDLMSIPSEIIKTINIVDVFRRSGDVPPIVNEAIKLHKKFGRPKIIWMQLGIVSEESASAARKAGLTVVMDKCMMVEHRRFFG